MPTDVSMPPEPQQYLKEIMEGTSEFPFGLSAMLENHKKTLEVLKRESSNTARPKAERIMLSSNSRQFQDSMAGIELYKKRVEWLRTAPEMVNAYALLLPELKGYSEWRGFLGGALRAALPMKKHRETPTEAKTIANDIAESAKALISSLRKFQRLNLEDTPLEFISIQHLLRETDSSGPLGIKLGEWRILSPEILGHEENAVFTGDSRSVIKDRPPVYDIVKEESDLAHKRLWLELSQYDESLDPIQSAWNMAPDLTEILETVANRASQYKPEEKRGMVRAATTSRESNAKMEYLRAFVYILTNECGIALSKNIKKAIAIVATTVLANLKITVTDQEVRQSLKNVSALHK